MKDEPTFHGWIFDFMAGADMGPNPRPKKGRPANRRAEAAALIASTWPT